MSNRFLPVEPFKPEIEAKIHSDSSGATPSLENSCFWVNCNFDYRLNIYTNGNVGKNVARMTPLIFISESTIEPASQYEKYKGLPKYLLPYIHEFNHFALFCFQELPDALAGIIGWQNAEQYGEINRLDPTRGLRSEQLPWFRIYAHSFCVSEHTQDFLTAQILDHMGYNGKQVIDNPESRKSFLEYGIRDVKTLFDFSANWYRKIRPFDKFQERFFKTLGNIKVIKEPVSFE